MLSLVESLFEETSFTRFAFQSECCHFKQWCTRIITGHVIYNPAYTYKFQLKTTHLSEKNLLLIVQPITKQLCNLDYISVLWWVLRWVELSVGRCPWLFYNYLFWKVILVSLSKSVFQIFRICLQKRERKNLSCALLEILQVIKLF